MTGAELWRGSLVRRLRILVNRENGLGRHLARRKQPDRKGRDSHGVPHFRTGPACSRREAGPLGNLVAAGAGNGDVPPKYLNNIAADLKPEEVPLQPWAAALFKQRGADLSKDFPYTRCLPPGVPMISSFPAPWKIIQNPGLIAILYENSMTYRQIFTDGRVLSKDANPSWMGYSVGHWEGDSLVVETTGFNDKTWLDFLGHPHTDALRVIERFHRRDFGHMDVQFTFDDPKAYTMPWTVKIDPVLLLDGDLFESVCNENEKDLSHLVGK